VTHPDAAQRERLLTDFCLQTALPVEKVAAIIDRSGLQMEERLARIRRLSERSRTHYAWFLRLARELDVLESEWMTREWRVLSGVASSADDRRRLAAPTQFRSREVLFKLVKPIPVLPRVLMRPIAGPARRRGRAQPECVRVAVMYACKIVEEAPVGDLFAHPLHPYTEGLLESIVSLDKEVSSDAPLPTIAGTVPDLLSPPSGCRFHPRCKYAFARCKTEEPRLLPQADGRRVACFLYEEGGSRAAERSPGA